MSDDAHFRLRVPVDLKRKIEKAARESKRSLNSEILARLEASFIVPLSGAIEAKSKLTGDLTVKRASGSATVSGVGEVSADYQIIPSSELQDLRDQMARIGEELAKLAKQRPDSTEQEIFDTIRKGKAGEAGRGGLTAKDFETLRSAPSELQSEIIAALAEGDGARALEIARSGKKKAS